MSTSLLQGTLDMLILWALSRGPDHGYGVIRWIRQVTDEDLAIEEGALYPALHRLRAKGWLEAEWGLSENRRQAKYYRLTEDGRRQMARATASWRRYVATVAKVLAAAS